MATRTATISVDSPPATPSTPSAPSTPAAPEQLALLSPPALPIQFLLDQRTRERGLAHIAALRAQLAARASSRSTETSSRHAA